MMKRNDGFTLIELMVSVAIGTLITLAATTTLLLGLRINAQTTDNIKRQNTTDMLVQVLQDVAEEPDIWVDMENTGIYGKDGTAYVTFENNTIFLRDTIFMEEVDSFKAVLTDLTATQAYCDVDYSGRVAVVAGNEHTGISPYWRTLPVAVPVIIPMLGSCESLNVGFASTLVAYEAGLKMHGIKK